MAQVFISYTGDDAAIAQRVAQALSREGYSVFYDANLAPGDSWDARIESELEAAKAVLVLWSPSSRDRQWVRNEARSGLRRGILCPAMAKRCDIPVEFDHVQAADLTTWRDQPDHVGWRQLKAALQAKCAGGEIDQGAFSSTATTVPPPHSLGPPNGSGPPAERRALPIPLLLAALAVGGLLVFGGGYTIWNSMRANDQAEQAWDSVDLNDAGALRAFISANPSGPLRSQAEQALTVLEEHSFEAAQEADTIEAFDAFLRDFPDSEHAIAARGRVAELQTMTTTP